MGANNVFIIFHLWHPYVFTLQSVTYEKKKFAEFLKTQNDGLELTREWLLNHVRPEDVAVPDDMALRGVVSSVITRAYLELLSWSDEKLLPEVREQIKVAC